VDDINAIVEVTRRNGREGMFKSGRCSRKNRVIEDIVVIDVIRELS